MIDTPSRPHRRRGIRALARRALTAATAAALAAGGLVAFAGTAEAVGTLGNAAAAHGKYFGTAVAAHRLGESDYTGALNREFGQVTAENEMKWDAIEPSQGNFQFGNADRIVNHARSQGMSLRGHTLVWHAQLPGWVNNLSATSLRSAMQNHINQLAGRYRGQIHSWDVVNEAFEENGTRRQSVFQRQLGNGFIAEAFRMADAADPNARLCYNDYNIERPGAKQDAVYNLVRDLKAQGVPIDCVGFQSHFNSASPVPSNFQQQLERFTALGVDVQLTELDIAGSGSSQAQQYRTVVQACLNVARCNGITVWGVTDKYSWRSGDTPLLLDGNYNRKPAYDAVLQVLGGSGNPGNPGTASCTVSYNETDRWGDRFNGRVVVTAGSAAINGWSVTVTVHSPQRISATWNGSPTWDSSGNVMTMRPNGNGSLAAGSSTSFGFTVMANGNWQAPTLGSCTATAA